VSFDRLSPETAQRIVKFRLQPLPSAQGNAQGSAQGPGKVAVIPVAPLRPNKP
jgi:hypothetical protein